jgi:N-acetylmuramoyl-L-alanine amidase
MTTAKGEPMRHINEIIVHATATRPEWMAGNTTLEKRDEIERWHVEDRGWSAIGYHMIIDRDGTRATGRPPFRMGAHVKGHNSNSLGVSLVGGFGGLADDKFSDNFTPAQDKELRVLIDEWQAKFPDIVKISGHNEYANKACPCFDVSEWLWNRRAAPPTHWLSALLRSLFGGKA